MHSRINLTHPFLESPRPSSCPSDRLKSQFACPQGRLGGLVGRLMAFKNAGMNRFAVETLGVRPADQILEIGFGHGRTLQWLAERAHQGLVAGVDLSSVMVRQAAKRNREKIMKGRVEVCQGSVANIPYEYARFDKVLAVNNYQFWPNAEFNLVEIQRVLRPDGLLVLCLRMKEPGKSMQFAPGFSQEEVEEVAGLVRWVGFREVKITRRRAGYAAACVAARR
jgi:ubiquinone/menaquinone biosynthesis C-methylase UbiE